MLPWFYTLLAFAALVTVWLTKVIRLAYDEDLRKIPGPWLSRFMRLPLKLTVVGGTRTFYIHDLHKKYGQFIYSPPNEVAFASLSSWHQIHKIGTRFRKTSWYQNQSPTQYSDETCGVFGVIGHKKASQRRRLYQQVATKAQVRTWEPRFIQIIDATIEKIKRDALANGKADLYKWWSMMTTDVLGEVAFGEPFGMIKHEKKPQLVKDIEDSMFLIGIRMEMRPVFELLNLIPIPSWRPIGMINRIREAGRRAVENTKNAPKEGGQTIFSKMYPEDDAPLFSDTLMQDEAANLIIAGSDTTAILLINLTYQVLLRPDIRKKLLDELSKLRGAMSWEDLEGLAYLNCVIEETLRVFPSVPGTLPRTSPNEDEILDGYKIPAGTICATQSWTLQRDPNAFPDPEKFDPDRWRNPTKEMRDHFGAFGGSMRICLGQNIARMETLHAVARFFTECPNVELSESVTPESMKPVDFFVIKLQAGKLEVVLK